MKTSTIVSSVSMAALLGLAVASSQAQGQTQDNPLALVDQYCSDCHNSEDWAGGLAFDLMASDVHSEAEVWEAVVRRLRGRLMPPPGSEQPDQNQIDTFVGWMESSLDESLGSLEPGHVPVQRMNRSEYALAVKALLGVDINGADYLPREMEVDGFDNIASALTMSPLFLDQYVNAARQVAKLAVGDAQAKTASVHHPVTSDGAQDGFQHSMPLGTRGGMRFTHHFPADGEYRFNILDLDVGLYPRSVETKHDLVLLIDGVEVFRGPIGGEEDLALVNKEGAAGAAKIMERFNNIPIPVTAGTREVTVTFIERARIETDELIGGFVEWSGFSFEGSLRVPRLLDGVVVDGPFNPSGVSMASRDNVFVCQPASESEVQTCARRIAENLARRAYRRPVTAEDIESLIPFFDMGYSAAGNFDRGVEQVVAAVLASPDFLFRSISPNRDIGDAQQFALTDLELASRLSFFLWSQVPDEELLTLATAGELSQPEVLEAQVIRMLRDERAQSLVNNFTLKWLNLGDLSVTEPDPVIFPGFNEALRQDLSEELKRFIASILLEDRPVTDLLDADHTFLNERLARHYGMTNVHGNQFRRVQLDNENRWGLLGKGAVLLRTSYGDRTSPVLRGAWVLEKIMGTPPSPPPPNVETDLSVPEGGRPTTVRERLEVHRDNPSCNQCHGVIDPIGLALENFTVTGQWRDFDHDAQAPIDASTVMPNGSHLNGPSELREELGKRPEQFVLAMTEKLMMYGLARELEYFDMPRVRAIVRQAEAQDYRLSAIVLGIVNSDAFRQQSLPHTAGSNAAEEARAAQLASTPVHPQQGEAQ